MKFQHSYVGTLLVGCLLGATVFAQTGSGPLQTDIVQPRLLAIGFTKTTNIVFPDSIKSVDLGSGEVVAQLASGVDNILQVKAGVASFAPTNLTVITSGSRLYSFLLQYAAEPGELNVLVLDPAGITPEPRLRGALLSKTALQAAATTALQADRFLRKKTRTQSMQLTLHSVLLYQQTLWLAFELANGSLIDYERASMRFFIRDRKRSKRTALQEKEIFPLICHGETKTPGVAATKFTCGFPVFTLSAQQHLVLQLREKNGGRALALRIKPRLLLKARLMTVEPEPVD